VDDDVLLLLEDVVVLEDELLAVLLVLDDDDAEEELIGVLPSFLAWTNASTNSPFSKNVLVEIPYDSNSSLIAETLMEEISLSKSVSVVLNS